MTTLLRRTGRAVLSLVPLIGLALALWATAPVAAARLAIPVTPKTWCVQATGAYTQSGPCSNQSSDPITDIQSAIDRANSGDTIEVSTGLYSSQQGGGYYFRPELNTLTIEGGFPGGSSPTGWTAPGSAGSTLIIQDPFDFNCFTVGSNLALTLFNIDLQCGASRTPGP